MAGKTVKRFSTTCGHTTSIQTAGATLQSVNQQAPYNSKTWLALIVRAVTTVTGAYSSAIAALPAQVALLLLTQCQVLRPLPAKIARTAFKSITQIVFSVLIVRSALKEMRVQILLAWKVILFWLVVRDLLFTVESGCRILTWHYRMLFKTINRLTRPCAKTPLPKQ